MDKEILLKSWFENKGEAKYRSELRWKLGKLDSGQFMLKDTNQ